MKLTYFFSFSVAPLVLATFCVMGTPDARADTLAFNSPGGITTNFTAGSPVNLGLVFTSNSTLSIDALGIYYQSSLTAPEQVGLYDASGNLLASATVSLSDNLMGGYLFHGIAPVTLTAGNTYTVDAYVGNNPWAYGTAAPITSGVTFKNSTYLYSGGLAFPTATGGYTYYGPNLEIVSNPEPRGLGLLVTLIVLGGCLYFRKSRPVSSESRVTAAQS
jgi:hypothetical protein